MKKVMFLIGKVTNIGGIPRVVSLLTDSLIKTGNFEIHVVAYLQDEETVIGYNWNTKVQFHSLLSKPAPMKTGIFNSSFKLRKLLKENKIETLVSCGSLFGPLGVLSTFFLKINLIYWDHSNYFENTSHNFKIKSKNFTALFANVVVPLTKHDREVYKKHTKAKRIEQIYNPIDVKLENLQHSYDINSKKIISVGRLKGQKNFIELVDVAKIVLDKHPEYCWHIFGSGDDYQKIKDKIVENDLQDRLILMGQSNDLYSLYKEYAMMVMTSKYEGFPMTLLEGMANKLPLVSFDILTGPNEIIVDGVNGFLINPFDFDDMANKIVKLIDDDLMRESFSTKNSNYVNEFNTRSITDKWVSLFNNL